MEMIKTILDIFRPPPALVIAARELEHHKRQLLSAQSSAEYAQGMISYHVAAIDRLSNYLKEGQ